VAFKEDVLTFFEVKYSKKYNPVYRITESKVSKIIKTVDYFFMKFNYDCEYQISAVLVTPEKIEKIENITI